MNFWVIFLTGLFGGVSCMAVQGGLLASLIASDKEVSLKWRSTIRLVVFFLIGKISVYTILGFFLGFVGSIIQMTMIFRVSLMVAASLFMIVTALNMLRIHPLFRVFALQPPRFFYILARKESKTGSWLAPFLVGTLTVFLPCGTTQAMMVTALQFGNPWISAGVLLAFTLGTIPLFLLLGLFMKTAAQLFEKYFMIVAGILLLSLAMWNLSNAAAITGLDISARQSIRPLYCQIVYCDDLVGEKRIQQEATTMPIITIHAAAYSIDNPNIPAGAEIHLKIKNSQGGGCIQFFTIPKLGIEKIVTVGEEVDIIFTAPNEKGTLPFMCSMGMYRGAFVIQ